MIPILAAWYVYALSTTFILICTLMMLVILIQKPKGGGLSGAFGGAGGSASAAFGAKTGDVLTIFTVGLFVAFLLCAMGLTWAVRPAHNEYMEEQKTLVEEIEQTAEDAVDAATPTLPGEEIPEPDPAEPASTGTSENSELETRNSNPESDTAITSEPEDLSNQSPRPETRDPEPQTP